MVTSHLGTELRKLGSEQGRWGAVWHGRSTGKVVAVCVQCHVMKESRKKVVKGIFRMRALAVREESRAQGSCEAGDWGCIVI